MTRFRPMRRLGEAVLGLLMLAAAWGCDSTVPAAQVAGTVFDGDEPLPSDKLYSWSVLFVGPDGSQAGGTVGVDGSYVVDNPPLGEVRVAVVGSQAGGMYAKGEKRPALTPAHFERVKRLTRYKDPTASGLTYTVTRGKQRHDIRLAK